ncbi:MAG: iron-containing alcohol dehydrogenase [Rhodocyclaceae bacterium]|nr:iron-containing alcohol dehydrogenase [Rhodocyclaceae bacterium]
MFNFTFHNPTKIFFGRGQISAISKEIPADARVLVTYGGGSVRANGVLDQVLAAIEGRTVFEFGGIEPNPSYETLMGAVEVIRRESIDFLLAVGGGSVIDGSKFLALAPFAVGDPWKILSERQRVDRALPLGTVLTLPATGSEMNSGAVITKKSEQAKLVFSSPLTFPRFSVLDPTTTFTLPVRQVANGVVDAFVHVVEQYLTYPVAAAVQDRYAEGLLLTLVEEGPRTLAQPEDYDARANLMWVACQALSGLIGAGVPQDWTTHMIGHELTARFGLDHARTLAVVLPATLIVRREAKREKLLRYADRVWGLASGAEEERMDGAIAATRRFFESLGVPTRLSDYGIGAGSIPGLVAALEAHGMRALGERRDVSLEVSRRILEAAL